MAGQAFATALPGALAATAAAAGQPVVGTARIVLGDGAATTVHVAAYPTPRFTLGVVRLSRPTPLPAFCAATGQPDAIVGGFYVRPHGTPLGELRTHGVQRSSVPFDAPWAGRRACVHVEGGAVRIARRDGLAAEPVGDLLQAGPLLVRGGAAIAGDDEGFSAGSHQFDSDITDGRHPRAALGAADGRLLAVACDGRADDEAGLTLAELAAVMLALGAQDALNLDGGGSTSLVCGGVLRNRPREAHGIEIGAGRAVSTALVFTPRPAEQVTTS